MLGKEEVFMTTPCFTVGCLGGSTVPCPAGTRYVVTKAGQLVSLEVLWVVSCLQAVRSKWPNDP